MLTDGRFGPIVRLTSGSDGVATITYRSDRPTRVGAVHVGLANLDPNRPASISASVSGLQARAVSGRVLTADAITAHNTFDRPEVVKPAAFNGASLNGNTLIG